jgi:hypothetical protein
VAVEEFCARSLDAGVDRSEFFMPAAERVCHGSGLPAACAKAAGRAGGAWINRPDTEKVAH